jgi:anti-sigma B factor antagonist
MGRQGSIMEIRVRVVQADVVVIELREDSLDASNVRAFKDTFTSLVGQASKVVLDMDGVKFVDSSGLGALISCLRHQHGRSGDLRLAAMSNTVRALFELMRMHRVFAIHATPDEAIRSFS